MCFVVLAPHRAPSPCLPFRETKTEGPLSGFSPCHDLRAPWRFAGSVSPARGCKKPPPTQRPCLDTNLRRQRDKLVGIPPLPGDTHISTHGLGFCGRRTSIHARRLGPALVFSRMCQRSCRFQAQVTSCLIRAQLR
jgi:hypothetical protein